MIYANIGDWDETEILRKTIHEWFLSAGFTACIEEAGKLKWITTTSNIILPRVIIKRTTIEFLPNKDQDTSYLRLYLSEDWCDNIDLDKYLSVEHKGLMHLFYDSTGRFNIFDISCEFGQEYVEQLLFKVLEEMIK